MSTTERIEAFWQAFLKTQPIDSRYRECGYISEPWGDSPELANELGALIKAGAKTAACSTLWEYEEFGDEIPEPGLITIVVDGDENPLCIIETIEVTFTPFNQVDEQFAYDEGEGDRSLAYWRECHWDYFTFTLKSIGKEPTEDMPLICERFRLLYSE